MTGIAFDLFPDPFRETAVEKLAVTIDAQDGRTMTGFAATPFLYRVLSDHGRADLAWQMLLSEEPGTLLDQAAKGATTIWENRNAYRETGDGGYELAVWVAHPAFGSAGHWLFDGCLGIRYDEERPGYRHVILQPAPDRSLAWAHGSYESPYGQIRSGWEYTDEGLSFRVRLPANTDGTMILPDGDWTVSEAGSGKELSGPETERTGEEVRLELPAGEFVIRER